MNELESAEERFLLVLKFYLSGWHIRPKVGNYFSVSHRKGVKNTFNPILGEIFRCSYEHDGTTTEYFAEQITHHPPSSAFCVWNRQKNLVLESYIQPVTKFCGNSVEAILQGSLVGRMGNFREKYLMTYPKYVVRGLLIGSLQMEIGGKVTIECPETKFSAQLEFRNKRLAPNSVVGSIMCDNKVLYSVAGSWEDEISITPAKSTKSKRLLKIDELVPLQRQVPPADSQSPNESRQVWDKVIHHMRLQQEDEALQAKSEVEEEQRRLKRTPNPQHFRQRSELWWEFAALEFVFHCFSPQEFYAQLQLVKSLRIFCGLPQPEINRRVDNIILTLLFR